MSITIFLCRISDQKLDPREKDFPFSVQARISSEYVKINGPKRRGKNLWSSSENSREKINAFSAPLRSHDRGRVLGNLLIFETLGLPPRVIEVGPNLPSYIFRGKSPTVNIRQRRKIKMKSTVLQELPQLGIKPTVLLAR